MFWFLIFCAIWTSVAAQLLPLSGYCGQVAPPCICESEANLLSVQCAGEYAMLLEVADTDTNIYLSYYAAFELSRMPRFDIAKVAKMEFNGYAYWSATFLSDLLAALGIETVTAIEFHDRSEANAIDNRYKDSSDDDANVTSSWLFSAVPELRLFKFQSCVKKLDGSIFQAFDSLQTLELELSTDRLPNHLLISLCDSLEALIIVNAGKLSLDPPLLRQLKQLRYLSLQLREQKNGKLQAALFAQLPLLEQVQLRGATAQLGPHMFRDSHNLRHIEIQDNDQLSSLPARLFHDQGNLTLLNLSANALSTLPDQLFIAQAQLQYLDLSYNRLSNLSSELFAPLVSLESLKLNFNSLRTLQASTFSELRSLNFIDMRGTQFYGTKLAVHYEALVCTNDDICQYKAEHWQCASHCLCFVKRHSRQLVVDCRHCNASGEFSQLPKLPHTTLVQTVLKLANNSLSALPDTLTAGYANVSQLYLADNQLSSLGDASQLPANLSYLDVRRNRISGFSDEFIDYLEENSMLTLSLAGNPLRCDCDALPLLSFVRAQPHRVRDIGELQCFAGGRAFQQLDALDLCPSYAVLIGGIVGVIVVFICLVSIFYLIYQKELKIWLYNNNWCLWWVSEQELDKDKLYDAFISYSHRDEPLIAQLLPKLESGAHAFRVCLHGRDWLVGDCIPEQIVRTVNDSKRIIIVLSQHFLESAWARMEFRIAYQATLRDKRKRIIIILYKELEHWEGIDSELRAYLKLNTYLKWGDPLFWSKLRYAMPHNRRVLKGQKQHPGPLI